MTRRPWTEFELTLLRRKYPLEGIAGCVALLSLRSEEAIYQKAFRLGLTYVGRTGEQLWSGRELALLRAEYPIGGLIGCRLALPERSDQAIYQQAFRMGLSAPPVRTLKWALAEAARLRQELRVLKSATA